MALSKFTPAQSVANQIRSKSLGVKTGGTQGRSTQVHKGVGLNRNSGGLNARGSGKRITGTFGTPLRNPGRASTGTFTASKPATPKPVTRPAPAATPVSAAPAPAMAPKPVGPIEYRGMSSYLSGDADLTLQLKQDRAGLQRQLDESKIEYGKQMADSRRGYARAIEDSEDEMNHAGLLRSGKREVVDADRFREFNDHLASVEKNLGAGAAAQITEALARLDEYEAQQRLALEARAREDYNALNPAAPLDVTPAPEVPAAGGGSGGGGGGSVPAGSGSGVVSVPAGTGAPQSPWLRVYVPNGKGGYKIGNQARNTMSPAELRAALASPLNRGRS